MRSSIGLIAALTVGMFNSDPAPVLRIPKHKAIHTKHRASAPVKRSRKAARKARKINRK